MAISDKTKRNKPPRNAMTIVARATFGPEEIEAAAGGKKARTVEITAYTGGPLDQYSMGWGYPVIVDLEGLDSGNGIIPLLDNHGPSPWSDESLRTYVAGQSTQVKVENNEIHVKGKVFDVNECGRNILALADATFAWQASIGAKAKQKDFIAEGNTVQVNGKTFDGPCYVARKTKLREVSFVVIGADSNTEVVVASGRQLVMNFAQYVQAKTGKTLEELDDDTVKASLQAEFDGAIQGAGKVKCDDGDDDEDEDDEDEDDDNDPPPPKKKVKGKMKASGKTDLRGNAIVDLRGAFAAETKRCNAIRAICASDPTLTTEINGRQVNILEHAIEAGWSANKTERIVLREERKGIEATAKNNDGGSLMCGSPFFYSTSKAILNTSVVEAALMQAGGSAMNPLEVDLGEWKNNPNKTGDYVIAKKIVADNKVRYSDQVQQAAQDHFGQNGISLHDLLRISAGYGGYRMSAFNRINDASLPEMLEAAFSVKSRRTESRSEQGNIRADGGSVVSLTSALANLLNKYLGFGYLFTDGSWRKVTSTAPTKDFKPTLAISLTGDFVFKKLGSNGEIPAAALTDEAYTNQISTFARKLSLARQTLIDDDTSSLTVVPKLIGIGALDAISITMWTLWNSPTAWGSGAPNRGDGNAFWSNRTIAASLTGGGAMNTNYQSGSSTNLQGSSLQTAWQQQMKQVKPNGQPLGVMPTILLIPPELDGTARQLLNSEYVVATGVGASAATTPSNNVWKGRFDLVESPYLSNSAITGYSTTAFWTLSDPNRLAAIEARFLNGQETPTVLNVNLNNVGNELGISIIGFLDFGVAMQNPRAGQMSKGAA